MFSENERQMKDRELEGMERARIAEQMQKQSGAGQACDTAGTHTVAACRTPDGLPTRYDLRQRRQKLIEELMLVDACLSNWNDGTDAAIRLSRDLQMLGYFV